MTHLELVFYRLYPESLRITINDSMLGNYEYLCKNDDDANTLLAHINEHFGIGKAKGVSVNVDRLYKEAM